MGGREYELLVSLMGEVVGALWRAAADETCWEGLVAADGERVIGIYVVAGSVLDAVAAAYSSAPGRTPGGQWHVPSDDVPPALRDRINALTGSRALGK